MAEQKVCVCVCVCGFPRQGFSVALEPVLELVLVVQAGLKTHRDPPASAPQSAGIKGVLHHRPAEQKVLF